MTHSLGHCLVLLTHFSGRPPCAHTSHYTYSGFWRILAYFCPKVPRFLLGINFSCVGKH